MKLDGHILKLDEFCDLLRTEFEGDINPSDITSEARLVDDLQLDSLDLLRLVAVVESLAPIEMPEQLDPGDAAIGDLYHYYVLFAERAAVQPPRILP